MDGDRSWWCDGKSVKLTQFQASPPPAQLLNISTRGYVTRGDDPFANRYLIGGFIIRGNVPKTVIVRGLGPSLGQRGVAGSINDPRLELRAHGRSDAVATNGDWRDTQQSEIQASGLAPEDSRESAIKATLEPGIYTVIMDETNGLPGTGLIEVYDLSATIESRLANISTRGYAEPGGALIGGIIAGGEGQANADIVARAVRLRFTDGTFTPMADPTLEIRDSNGVLVAFSDGNERSGDAGPPPSELAGANEVLRLSLPHGLYTALVWDKNGGPGTTLVEFYDLRR